MLMSGRLPAHEPKVCPHGHLHQRSGQPGPAGDPHWPSHLQELPPQQGWKVRPDGNICCLSARLTSSRCAYVHHLLISHRGRCDHIICDSVFCYLFLIIMNLKQPVILGFT